MKAVMADRKLSEIDILANDIAKTCPDLVEDCCGSTPCYTCIANSLYGAGYRKVGDSVVVTKEDYSDFLKAKRNWKAGIDLIKEQFEIINKSEQQKWRLAKALAESKTKTAEEIIELIISESGVDGLIGVDYICEKIREKYGVEVEE